MVGNIIGLILICLGLIFAYYSQFVLHVLPDRLCIMQRLAYSAMGIALCFNLTRGARPLHYGLLIIATAFLMFVAAAQVGAQVHEEGTVHAAVSASGYNTLIGYIVMLATGIALLFQRGFFYEYHVFNKGFKVVSIIFLILMLLNAITTFVQCGIGACSTDPRGYKLLNHNDYDTYVNRNHDERDYVNHDERDYVNHEKDHRAHHPQTLVTRHTPEDRYHSVVVKKDQHLGNTSSSVAQKHLATKHAVVKTTNN